MSNVPTNLIPSKITQLPEYTGTSTDGYFPYDYNGRTYKVQFGQLAAAGAVPASREINTGNGLTGGGNLTQNRTISIANGGVGSQQLDQTGVVAGTYGSASTVPQLVVDANGRLSSVVDVPIVLSGYVPDSRTITAGTGLTGGGTLNANRTLAIDFSNATPEPLGTPTAGVGVKAAREDHVHPAVNLSDTTETQGSLPLARGGTGNSLSPVAGAILYSDGTNLELTNPGNAGEVLVSNGSGMPYWAATGGGTVTSVDATGGTGISVSGGPITSSGALTITNTAPDQVVSITGAGTSTVTGTYPNFTITSADQYTGTVTSVAASAGTGISVSGSPITSSGTITITNTAPDQVVSLTGTGTTSITGTYPNFTINSDDQYDGTVTSVDATGGTGISVSGGPITSSGTLTITNTAPDQIVSITGAGTSTVTGTYPNFTITSADQYVGTVTSVSATGGTGISVSGGPITSSGTLTITNTAPDQVVSLTGAGTVTVTGTYPNFTITGSGGGGSGTVTSVDLTAGTGISVSGGPITTSGSITVTNTAPDQIVSLTGAGTTSVTGTYPNFTITSADQYTGTVTSVGALNLTSSAGADLSSTVANSTTTPVITLNVPDASATQRGALTSTDWSTFNGKQAALVSGTNIKTVGGNSLLGSGDVGTIGVGYGGTGLTGTPTNGQLPIGNGTGYTLATITQGTGITVTNGAGAITIASTVTGLTNWTDAVNTSAPNATVPAVSLTATNAATNVDAVISAKGTGSLLAQIPDNGTTGGNKRGTNAVDWQRLRTANTQVASGGTSTIGGGQNNTASNTNSTVSGGSTNTAAGTGSTVSGGVSNSATGVNSYVGGGTGNSASTTGAAAISGYNHTATGRMSAIMGGSRGTARSIAGLTVFPAADAPVADAAGVSQSAILILGAITTDATPTTLVSQSGPVAGTNQLTLPNNSAYYFKGRIIANVTGGGNTSAWTFEGAIKRGANAASTAIVGSVNTVLVAQDSGASTWVIALTADTTNGGIAVTVTGAAATTIRWVCRIETTEVTF